VAGSLHLAPREGLTTPMGVPVASDLLPVLRAARDLIDRDYARDLTLADMARTAGLSKYHFLRCFTATYGQTPAQYLAHRRIERAQDLLRATNLTVTEVCRLVGYESLGSFSSRFTELAGISPSAYQRRYAEAGAPMIPGCFLLMIGLQDRYGADDSAISEKP
jgi:AraC-like DNA-binding protein